MCNLEINKLIEIEVKSGDYIGRYPSRIDEIDDKFVFLAAPIKKGYLVPLTPGTELKISFLHQNAIFSFESVLNETKGLPLPVLVVNKPEKLNRIQRRNYVRIEAWLEIKFSIIGDDFETITESYCAQTLDISGGGIKFTTSVPLHKDQIINVEVMLPGIGTIIALGQVVRVQEALKARNAVFLCSVAFTIMEESYRDQIIRYIFEKQRQLRAKGLL